MSQRSWENREKGSWCFLFTFFLGVIWWQSNWTVIGP
jgi:hypothetical protein